MKKRNEIEGYRRQDLRPVERTQDLRPEERKPEQKEKCPACKGMGKEIGNAAFPCQKCKGEGEL